MAWRYHGRASVSSSNPQAFGVCDRCGIWYNRKSLRPQYEWAGQRKHNLNLYVCHTCTDVPQHQLRARILPPDPVPIDNPRPENFAAIESAFITTNSGSPLMTEDGNYLVAN